MLNSSSYCTSGFAVTMNSGSATQRMLGAAHCDANGDPPTSGYMSGQQNWISYNGNSTSKPEKDSLLIRPNSGTTRGYMYGGDTASGYVAPVRNASSVAQFEIVRVSGANSGQHNNIRIGSINVLSEICIYPYSGYTCEPMAWGELVGGDRESLGSVVVVEGDSGGPVYTPVGGGDPGVIANGIIHGGSYPVPEDCFLYPTAVPIEDEECDTRVYFFDIVQLDNEWNNAWNVKKVLP